MGALTKPRRSALIPPDAGGGWLMAVIVGALAFVACLSLAAAVGASRAADLWSDGLATAATVRVSAFDEGADARVQTALRLLGETPGVQRARALTREEVADLLKPWFGEGEDFDSLPAPRVIEVTLDPSSPPDPGVMQARLDGAQLQATYDGHDVWRGRAAAAARAVRLTAICTLAAVLAAMLAAIVSSVRGGMGAQRHVIAALRLSGAEDRFVAAIYQRRFLVLGGLGALIGVGLGMGVVVAFTRAAHLRGLAPGLEIPGWWPFAALGVVGAAALAAMFAARAAAFAALRRET
ncbi:FtsX-like permease family protein [Neomegalonema sp.]|uniref:cell division protein FtsX n=1 Tax=Neomegalonema sp. TaxID=2039713 RepID=UPI002622DC09|nr:FtsX-like permease family protein [Neomegalonema sp.]MDD2869598.1 hypothetical protein [Neomegalonema sp.]